jgi:uncharacterized damage-inducible protein DinB
MRDASQPQIALLLALLDQSYDKKAWHGPNLRGAIRRLSAAQAAWRPNRRRHNIAEHVVHAAYWKYAVRRRLRGEKRGAFPLKGSNWFTLPQPLSEETWRGYLSLLDEQHRALRQAVAEFPEGHLHRPSPGSKFVAAQLIYGIASHDLYHVGQIQLLKRLQAATEEQEVERSRHIPPNAIRRDRPRGSRAS